MAHRGSRGDYNHHAVVLIMPCKIEKSNSER